MLHTHTHVSLQELPCKNFGFNTSSVCKWNATQLHQVHSSKFSDISFLLIHETTSLAGRKSINQSHSALHSLKNSPKLITSKNVSSNNLFRKKKRKDNYQNIYLLDLLALPRHKTHCKLKHWYHKILRCDYYLTFCFGRIIFWHSVHIT